MGVLEEISENLDSTEAKKNSLRKSICILMSDWREFEKHLELTQERFQECFSELESREKNLNSVPESVRQSSGEWKITRQRVEERVREIEDKEKRLVLLEEKGMMELASNEKEWELSREKLVDEFREKEVTLNEKEILINGLSEKLELEKNELAVLEKLVEERLREVGLMEERIEERRKDIELIEDGISKRVNELDGRERKVKELEKMVGFKCLDFLRVDQERSIEMKEKEVSLIREDLELKQKEIDIFLAFNDKRVKELDMREKQLEVKEKDLEVKQELMKEVQLKKKECLEEKELLERGNKELELKKKELEDSSIKSLKELLVSEEKLKAKWKELEIAEKSLKECKLKKKQCKSEKELLEAGIKELEVKSKELEDKIKGMKEFEVREKQLEAKREELEEVTQERLKLCQLKEEQCQSEKELFEKRNKEFEDRIKAFEIREKEFEVKENKLNDKLHAREPAKKVVDKSLDNNSSSPTFTLAMELDGLDVHMYLDGLKIDLSSEDEVLKALRVSGAPVYLVLNAIEALYPPYLMKADMRFEGTVARSCIVLLEQLIRISPKIQSRQREHALKLAREWKEMMSAGNSLEVLGFLYLLASFDLASAFDAEEVMKFLETAAEHQQMPELCRRLGLRDKVPGVIRNLLKSNEHSLRAIRLIHAFDLVDQFPPVPILKNYLKHFKRIMKAMPRNTEKENDAIDQRIAAMKAVIRCIVDHKLESQYSPKILEESIQQLLMQKVHEKFSESVVQYKAQDRREVEGRKIPFPSSGSDVNLEAEDQQEAEEQDIPLINLSNWLKGCKIDPKLSNTDLGSALPMALILASMNGKSLLSFLEWHLVDHRLLQNEVSTALQISNDSAKLVLNVVEEYCSSYPQDRGSRSCIFLLDQFMRISPLSLEGVKEIAQRIALDWRAKIRAEFESPLVILVFLLFIGAFRLATAFDSIELLQLYKIVLDNKLVPELCQSLGISEMISGVVYSQSEIQQLRAEDLQLEINSATSTLGLEKHVESLRNNVNMESEEHVLFCGQIPRFIQYSSDPAQLVLDALYLSYLSDSQENMISQLGVVKSFFYLLKQLMSVSPEIKPCVKRGALKLAFGWKSKLTYSNSWEVLAFLQLVGVYGLSSSFGAKYLLGRLEVLSQMLKEASNLIRILGLENKVPGFIRGLIGKKQRLLAFEYVYEFNLVDKIPPVALLRKHVSDAKQITKELCKDGQTTPEAQDRAIFDEISVLQNVIKCILDHSLQSEYSPDKLRERVAQLETKRTNLKTSMQAKVSENFPKLGKNRVPCASEKAQLEQEDTRKRPASDGAISKEARKRPSKKSRHLNLRFFNAQSSLYVQPSSHHPDGLHAETRVVDVPKNNNWDGFNPAMPRAHHAASQYGSGDGKGNMVHSRFSFKQFGCASDRLPPYGLAGEQFFP